MVTFPAPLFRDPIHDGATDPALVRSRADGSWWMFYTGRRPDAPDLPDVSWVHGSDIGIATTRDGGATWLYLGVVEGLDLEWGRHTYWAPEVVDDGERYHMYVSVIRGVPDRWEGHERAIRHYTSDDLAHWTYRSTLDLSSRYVIDACVAPLPDGGWRLWYKDEADDSATWFADSPDLFTWTLGGRAVAHAAHEGPNVFRLAGIWWMIVDEWHGQGVLRSDDLLTWRHCGYVLDGSGIRADDIGPGYHADVVVHDDDSATIVYFTHPDREGRDQVSPSARRSALQAATLRVVDDRLVCERDAPSGLLPH